jgi:hypothetical protein
MTGLRRQEFKIPVDLTGPATLNITPGQFGLGNFISIIGEDGEDRKWYAEQIYTVQFVYGEEENEPSQSAEKVGILSADQFVAQTLWDVPVFREAERMSESPRKSRSTGRL